MGSIAADSHSDGGLSLRGSAWARPGQKISWLDVINDLWDPKVNPNGFACLGIAENHVMHKETLDFVNKNLQLGTADLNFGDSLSGSSRLKNSVAQFIDRHFQPAREVLPDHVAVTAGVGPAMETVAFSILDPGDAVLLARPYYRGFPQALGARSNNSVFEVNCGNADPFGLVAISKFEEALAQAKAEGRTVKAIMICNPHNPLGRCYTREAIRGYMQFCQRHQLHLLSDEIYAASVWENPDFPNEPGFCSVLSVNTDGLIDPSLVHAFWGMSKDIGCNGIRLGFIISQNNKPLHRALETNSIFPCPSSLSDKMSSLILGDANLIDIHLSTNRTRLAQRFTHVTKFLQAHNIVYEARCNAAIFVWADMFSYCRAQVDERLNMAPESEREKLSWQLEKDLDKLLWKHKVFIGTGKSFAAVRAGWFRITFSLSYECLDEGLGRIITALDQFRKEL